MITGGFLDMGGFSAKHAREEAGSRVLCYLIFMFDSQRPMIVRAIAVLLLAWTVSPVYAADAQHFYSFKSDNVNMREGPSDKHRIKWVYRRKGLPVEMLAQFEVWRRVRDQGGEIGWVHVAMLSTQRTGVIAGKGQAPVRTQDDSASDIIGLAQPGAIGRLRHCGPVACEVDFGIVSGWVDRARLWGVDDDEHF